MAEKKFTLCADDYGCNAEVSHGITNLISQQRLSATSCMTNMPNWPTLAPNLLPCKNKVAIGLHLNFTDGKPLGTSSFNGTQSGFPSHHQFMIKAYLRQLDKQALENEIQQQIAQFTKYIGQEPDFIDGHQHVHQLPQVRQALLDVYQKNIKGTCFVRLPSNGLCASLQDSVAKSKSLMISATGSLALKKLLQQHQIPYNTSFAGIYPFSQAQNYRAYFLKFLQSIKNGGLIMCHPGLASNDTNDPIAESRFLEYQYFSGDVFLADLSEAQSQLL